MISGDRQDVPSSQPDDTRLVELLSQFADKNMVVAEIWLGRMDSKRVAYVLAYDHRDIRWLQSEVRQLSLHLGQQVGPQVTAELSPLDPRQAEEARKRGLFYACAYQRQPQVAAHCSPEPRQF